MPSDQTWLAADVITTTTGTGYNVTYSSVLAEGGKQAGGFNPMMIVLLLLVVLMIFMMFRNRKKAQNQQEEKKTRLIPGAKVMTTAGIFGTVRSVDLDENKVVLEVAPGQDMTFHAQAVSTFVEDSPAAPTKSETEQRFASNSSEEGPKDEGEETPGDSTPRS